MIRTDVVIIGAGPIGLELAVSLKHAGVEYLQIDAGQIGQTIGWYPRQARFFSSPERIAIAGVPLTTIDQSKATREEYLAYLRAVVQQFDLKVNTYERVIDLRPDPVNEGFLIRTRRGDDEPVYAAQRVVLAVGDMHRPRLLHVPGEELGHVSHYFEEPHEYFRQKLLIVGGRNSAAEAAIRCHRAGAQVSISYRRPEFDEKSLKYWITPELKGLIKAGHITFYPCTLVQRIQPRRVTLRPAAGDGCGDGDEAKEATHPAGGGFEIEADFVLLLTGYEMDPTLFEMAGVELVGESRSPKVDPETMETNVPGLYVAGTAAAGTQLHYRLFIENCHVHVARIVRHITGNPPAPGLVNLVGKEFALPES